MAATDALILALDAGGTSTRAIVARANGDVLGTARTGPGNHILASWETVRTALTAAVNGAIAAAGCNLDALAVAVVGSAGVGPQGEGRQFVDWALGDLFANIERLRVTGDMVTALWGALHPPVGVVVSAGTGSVCYGRNAAGATRQVGGWGHVMGDEGSAYDIAVRGLRALARATDGRGPRTALTDRLVAAIDARDPIEAALRLYSEPFGRDQIAALAVQVVGAAAAGDEVAAAILRDAADELALAAATALRTLDLLGAPAAVSFAGAVFDAGASIRDPFETALRNRAPLSGVQPPRLPPLGGAFCLGLEALGHAVDVKVVERLQIGLAGF